MKRASRRGCEPADFHLKMLLLSFLSPSNAVNHPYLSNVVLLFHAFPGLRNKE